MYGKFGKLASKAAAAFLSLALAAATIPAGISSTILREAFAAEPAALAGQHSTFRIVGIGDSLTAGYEHGLTADSVQYGYVERVYEQALFRGRAEYSNYGVLGLNAEGLQNWLSAVEQGQTASASDLQAGLGEYPLAEQTIARSAKLRANLIQADLVVMTIGSNDFATLFGELQGGREASDAWLEKAMDRYESAVTAALRSIFALRPQAHVVISDLYSPVPGEPLILAILGITEDDYDYLISATGKIRERLDAIIERFRGEGYKMSAAATGEAFVGKEGSYTSIVTTKGKDLHPNQAGYAAIGDAFAAAVWGEVRTVAQRPPGVGISVVVNGQELINDNKPVLKDNRTYLAFRDIANAMNATTRWNNKTKTVTISLEGKSVALTIGSSTMLVNGAPVKMDTPPFLHTVGRERKTYVPLAVLADGLGFQVEYRGKLKTAFINK